MASPFTPKFVDLVKNITTTTGTGDFVLGAAVNGFTSFTGALSIGERFYYACLGVDKPAEREVGRGTLLSGGKIAREPVNGAARTSFTSGNKTIALIAAAEWYGGLDGSIASAVSAADAAATAADAASGAANAASAAAAAASGAVSGLQGQIDGIDADIGALAAEVTSVDADVGALGIQVASLDGELDGTVQDVAQLSDALASLEAQGGGAAGGSSNVVATRAALASQPGTTGVAILREGRRTGLFRYEAGDFSAAVAADPLQGAYVAPASDPSGASGAWVRQGDTLTPFHFGAQTNYRTGNRGTMVPPYGESATPGAIDGVLVDSRAACQAMIDLIAAVQATTLWKGDFSGGLWGIAKRNDGGPHAEDGLVFDHRGEFATAFTGGDFRGIGGGRNLIYVDELARSTLGGFWHLRSGPDGGSSYGYGARQWENGLWVRNSAQSNWGFVQASGFQRWGVIFDPEYSDADYNNNIGLSFERIYANNCGSKGTAAGGYGFEIGWTASARSGSSGSYSQRTDLTLAAGHEVLRSGDIVTMPNGDYHLIVEKTGNVVSLYPWTIDTAATGTLTSRHGGGVKVQGKDVAGLQIRNVTGITCGVSLDLTNILHGVHVGEAILEGSGIGLLVGTVNGIGGLGHTIDHIHSESVERDIVAINSQNVGIDIGSASAFAGQNYADAFAECEVLIAHDGNAKSAATGLPQLSINLGGASIQTGATHGSDVTATKSRAWCPTLTNNPSSNRIRKVENGPTNVTLKYYESIDRCARDHFGARLEVSSAGGGAPSNAVTVTIDAGDTADGIAFANGSTTGTYVVPAGRATGPLILDFWLDTDGAAKRWVVMPRSGIDTSGVFPVNGRTIDDSSGGKTKVVAAPQGGYRITRAIGGGAWDAQASSSAGVTGDVVLRVKGVAGSAMAGLSTDAAASVGTLNAIVGIYCAGGTNYLYSYGSQVGGALPTYPYYFVAYTQADTTVRVYGSATGEFAAATPIGAPVGPLGGSPTWYFDSAIYSADAVIDVIFDTGADSSPFADASVNVTGSIQALGTVSGSNLSGINSGDQFVATPASRLIGRGSAGGAGAAQEITIGSGLAMSGTTLSATGSSGADPWTYLFLGSDIGSTSVAPADVAGLAFAPAASKTYEFEAFLPATSAATTTGVRPGIAWPSGAAFGAVVITTPQSSSVANVTSGSIAAEVTATTTASPTVTDQHPATIKGTIRMGSSPAGNLQVRLSSEVAGSAVTIKAGSWIKYREVA